MEVAEASRRLVTYCLRPEALLPETEALAEVAEVEAQLLMITALLEAPLDTEVAVELAVDTMEAEPASAETVERMEAEAAVTRVEEQADNMVVMVARIVRPLKTERIRPR